MKSFLVISISLIVLDIDYTWARGFCMSDELDPQPYLGAKTPYRTRMNPDMSPIIIHGCEAVQFWTIVRHGTRYPSAKVIRSMKEGLPLLKDSILRNYDGGRGSLCFKELYNFGNWSTNVEEANEKQLTHEGEDEMQDLAERWLNRLPSLLTENYDNSSYEFRHTATQRTALSARQFATGLFGRYKAAHVWYPEAIARDPLIRFYKLCPRWKKDVDKNPASLTEKMLFQRGPEIQGVLKRVSDKLGFPSLTYHDVHLMYVTCGFETAWSKKSRSPWCAPFSEEDLKVMEYNEDLEYYWIDGYGYEINYKQACPPLKDLLDRFRSRALGKDSQKKGIFYFTHSGTLLKLISRLGLYKDEEKLRSDNFSLLKRKWRTSELDSFGTNLAFILFKCDDGFKIAGYHQEKPFIIPGCEDHPCPLDRVLAEYESTVLMCEFAKTCSLK
ncbi:multiple inositol polyphosphate phosphatase 1 [Ischnura elegans]|uniref:multiple inositol polyphosphate phosphatase 1 n=1 Tax=Ischnura elegans TaxID=197161 RepID=UPI001ED8ACEE|nr:multiple inositol polyphosphate phosphatase 1 [Ischnura elegans]